jgi:protein gp37
VAEQSAIEWTDETLNFAWGCTKKDAPCAHCYIEDTPPFRKEGLRFERGHIPLRFFPDRIEKPLRRRKPRKIFVNSLSDTFHEDMPVDLIDRLFGMVAACDFLEKGHVFQILTKRPERMRDYLLDPNLRERLAKRAAWNCEDGDAAHDFVLYGDRWPLPNVWCGATIGNRRSVHYADVLRATPAAVRFISAEPLLGPLSIGPATGTGIHEWPDGYVGPMLCLAGIDWLIVGGESGPEHRPIQPTWVRNLRDAARTAGTAFFFKQWGGRTPKSGGRELDGRTWDEFPGVARQGAGGG